MDLADRISRGVVAALELAPFDARFGELSRRVLQGGASRFATVVDPTQSVDLVVPVGVPEASVNFGALVLQRSRVGLLWRDAHDGDRTALVAIGSATRATWTPVTLGNEEWTRFVVDDRNTRVVFLTPPTETPALRRAVAHLVRAQAAPDEGIREDLPDTQILPAIKDDVAASISRPDASPTLLVPAGLVDTEQVATQQPAVEEPDTLEQPAIDARVVDESGTEEIVDESTLEQPAIKVPWVEEPSVEEVVVDEAVTEDAAPEETVIGVPVFEEPEVEPIVPVPAPLEPTAAFTPVFEDERSSSEDHSLGNATPQTGSDVPVRAAHPVDAAAVLPPAPAAAALPPVPASWEQPPTPAWQSAPPPAWQETSPTPPWQPTPAPWQASGAHQPLYRDEPRVPQQHPWSAGQFVPPPPDPAATASSSASLTLVGFLAGLSITLLVGGIALVLLLLG